MENNTMKGKICLVTGATAGIGEATALLLAKLGATVVGVGRNPAKIENSIRMIKEKSGNPDVAFLKADLSSQKDIRELAQQFKDQYSRLDVLVNNAGATFTERQQSIDGIEMTFALNHLGYFLLTNLLLDLLEKGAPARIINVSSSLHKMGKLDFGDIPFDNGYTRSKAYQRTKLANIAFTAAGLIALAAGEDFDLGTAGAGVGATTALLKGGLGSASLVMPEGITVGALVVANPHGSVVAPGGKAFWAAPFEMHAEFGGIGMPASPDPFLLPRNDKLRAYEAMRGLPKGAATPPAGPSASMNTTIAIVATNAIMDKAQLLRMAVAAQDGMARAIVPSHTPFDGDLVFALSTAEVALQKPVEESSRLGHAAAVCLSRAIARAIYLARPAPGDTLPTWRQGVGADGKIPFNRAV